jgi:DNA repair exonuclease SbcCD ATPase subunit
MRNYRKAISILAVILLLAAPVYVWAERQDIYDFWRLRNYQAPAEIAQLADQTSMTDYARKIFYVMHPALSQKEEFNDHCRKNEQTIVLGCHVSADGIYLLKVDDPRLTGVLQVTAAHEMLHEAYDRLNARQRADIDKMVDEAYSKINEERLNKTVELYRQQDATVVPNELHAILGTEYRNLTPELEEYYTKYFNDRTAVVTFSEQYEDVFEQRRNAVNQYDAQLSALRSQIDSMQAGLAGQQDDLDARRAQLDSLLRAGRTNEYNASVPGFNEAVRAYNESVAELRALVTQFNEIVEARNAIASEEAELVEAIDSRVQPETTK